MLDRLGTGLLRDLPERFIAGIALQARGPELAVSQTVRTGVQPKSVNVSPDGTRKDNIVYDITPQPGQMPGVSPSGWGHPQCSAAATSIAANLPPTR